MGLAHPMNDIMQILTEVTLDEKNTPHGKLNIELLEKIRIKNDEDDLGPEPA